MQPLLPAALLGLLPMTIVAQYEPPDPGGLEGIIVETYYVADANDAADQDGSTELLEGATTYRVFVNMLPGHKLLTVGGFTDHPITISTSTSFFNNDDRGEAWGSDIPAIHLDKNTVGIDSWLTIGAASNTHWGIPKADDTDGSIIGGANNDGGSNGVAGGLLVNQAPEMGAPLTTSDGLLTSSSPVSVVAVGTPPDLFEPAGSSSYSDNNFAWAVLGGLEVPETGNKVLIGQFTTTGTLSFCLNLWIRIPDSLVCDDPNCHEILEFYGELLQSDTAGTAFNTQNKFTHPTLCFNSSQAEVDCNGVPDGPALPGTPCDDGIAATTNDIYMEDCTCAGEDCEGVIGGAALPGAPCEDGDPTTMDDVWTTDCLCVGVVSVDEIDAWSNAISLYPNPVSDQITIAIDIPATQNVSLEIKDATGRILRSSDLGTISNTWTGSFDAGSFSSGVYIVDVIIGEQHVVKRFTKS